MIKNKIELYGQILVLLSVFIQLFPLSNLSYQQGRGFEHKVSESLYFIARGIDQIEYNFVDEPEKTQQRMRSDGPDTLKKVGGLITQQEGNWQDWISIFTYINALLFFCGSAMILYEKHLKEKK
jgi:hypothetical protein